MGANSSSMKVSDAPTPRTATNIKAPPSSTRTANLVNAAFADNIAQCHNEYRITHKSHPLKINKKLSEEAQSWADRIAVTGNVEWQTDKPYGQNIYWSRWAADPPSVCSSWYKEGKHYKYDKEPNPPSPSQRNFTQMIWRGTSEIGVGKAVSSAGVSYVVATYKAKGNVKGEYLKNVKPPYEMSLERRKSELQQLEDTASTGFPKPMTDVTFQRVMLRLTNELRSVHNTKGLKINGKLTDYAQKHAEKMAKAKKIVSVVETPYGSSFYCSKWAYEPKDVIQFWYKESQRYRWGHEPDVLPLSTYNFTQLVWSTTQEVGYGRAQAENGFVYVAAFYVPQGNNLGEFTNCVKPMNVDAPSNNDTPDFDRKRSCSRAVNLAQK